MTAKNKYGVFLAPVIAMLMMGGCFAASGLFPFGNKSAAWCDMEQQTIPLLMQLKDILEGDRSIFYSTAAGGGMNFWGVFLFFLASPFSLLVMFVDKADFSVFMNILVVLKLSVCAASASFFFRCMHQELKLVYNVLLSLMYTFCGFSMMFYQNIIWLDIMYLFPLLLIGIERLGSRHKPLLYALILSLMVAVNYYLSFMVVIYVLLAVPLFIGMRCKSGENRKKVSLLFILSSMAAALITAPVWLPAFCQYTGSARGVGIVQSLGLGGLFYHFRDKLCVLMCTALPFAAAMFFIGNPKRRSQKVKYRLVLTLLLLIPVLIEPINKMWHTGSYQGFPLRYGYMVVLSGLSLAAFILEGNCKKTRSSRLCLILSVLLGVLLSGTVLTVLRLSSSDISSYVTTLWTDKKSFTVLLMIFVFCFAAYFINILFLRKGRLNEGVFQILLCFTFLIEFIFGFSVYIEAPSEEDRLFDMTAALNGEIEDEDYYRVKSEYKYIHVNMIGALGYNTLAHYTSLTSEDYMFAMKKLGYSSYWMEVGAHGGTCLTDALLANKYSIGMRSDFSKYQNVITSGSGLSIAENKICLPAGIISSTEPASTRELDSGDRYAVQKKLAENMLGSSDMLCRYDCTGVLDGKLSYTDGKYHVRLGSSDEYCKLYYEVYVDGEQQLYFDLFDNLSTQLKEIYNDSARVYVNGALVNDSYPSQLNNGLLNLGIFENEAVKVQININRDIDVRSLGVFGVDTEKLISAVNRTESVMPKVHGNKISVSCNGREGEYLYLAIPWDSGFDVKLNGKKTELYKVNDCFCAVKLESGENRIALTFVPKGFKAGMVLLLAGAVFSAVLFMLRKRIFSGAYGLCSEALCRILFTCAIAGIYALPCIIWAAQKIFF